MRRDGADAPTAADAASASAWPGRRATRWSGATRRRISPGSPPAPAARPGHAPMGMSADFEMAIACGATESGRQQRHPRQPGPSIRAGRHARANRHREPALAGAAIQARGIARRALTAPSRSSPTTAPACALDILR